MILKSRGGVFRKVELEKEIISDEAKQTLEENERKLRDLKELTDNFTNEVLEKGMVMGELKDLVARIEGTVDRLKKIQSYLDYSARSKKE